MIVDRKIEPRADTGGDSSAGINPTNRRTDGVRGQRVPAYNPNHRP